MKYEIVDKPEGGIGRVGEYRALITAARSCPQNKWVAVPLAGLGATKKQTFRSGVSREAKRMGLKASIRISDDGFAYVTIVEPTRAKGKKGGLNAVA